MTNLLGSGRVKKDSLRLESCGTIDELITTIGLVRVLIKDQEINNTLKTIQQDLFIVGVDLMLQQSTRKLRNNKMLPSVHHEMVQQLEEKIDRYVKELKPIDGFIIPGKGLASALLHFTRAVTRRAERRVVGLSRRTKINHHVIAYLNRLSSLIFVLARVADQREGLQEDVWHRKRHLE